MADSTEGDTEVQYLGLLASLLIALIPGLVIHSFIIGVNVNDWWKGRSVTPVDHITTSLGISRMCSQFIESLYIFAGTLFLRNLYSHVTLVIIDVGYAFFAYANFWLTALLSVVFCLKISNLQTRLFLYLRRTIVQRTVYFIVALVLLSACSCVNVLLVTVSEVTEGGTYNTSREDLFIACPDINSVYSYAIAAFFPLLFYCISSVLLFTSLYNHTTRMKMSSNLTINLETYYSAMKFVSFTFIYNTVYFFGNFVSVFYSYFNCANLPWFQIFLEFLPVLHSSYLIYRTTKLRNLVSKVLQNIIDFLFRRKYSENREHIEVIAQ